MFIGGKSKLSCKNSNKKIIKEKSLFFLLWLISKKERHGYEIIKILENDQGVPNITVGRIYPLLKELKKRNLVSSRKVMQGKRPRKVYGVTSKGKEALDKTMHFMKSSPLIAEFAEDMLK